MTCPVAFCFAALSLFAIDGDTFRDPAGQTYRIWGIDAPEQGEPGAARATETLAILLATHGLDCETAQARESHGRPVLRCDLRGGPFAGEDLACLLVGLGAARDWPRFSGGRYGPCAP